MMKLVKLSEYFEIKYGVNLELQNMELDKKGIPFVSRTSENQGVSSFVKQIENIKPNPANTISVACGGSVMESFLQKKDYYSGRDLFYLKPKIQLTENEMLYYCTCLRTNKYRYSYGRQANRTLGDIKIPSKDSIPDFVYSKKVKNVSKKSLNTKKVLLNKSTWQVFTIGNIFNLEKAKCTNAGGFLTVGNDIFYIGAKKNDNGVVEKVSNVDRLVSKDNGLVFIGDGEGSVGFTLYQPKKFIGSSTLTVGYNKKLNKFNAMFLVSILDLERYRYSFGRKYGKNTISKAKIKLPAAPSGEPDWQFMEDYIKSLPYSASL